MTAKQRKKSPKRPLRTFGGLMALAFLALMVGILLVGCSTLAAAPDVSTLEWESSTILYDRSGAEIQRLHAGENRTPVKLNQIPEHVVKAFVAIEDPNFYSHHGVDPKGVFRAAFRSALYVAKLPGGSLQGGSTITQQLARDAWLNQDVTVKRKVQEAWLAVQLERRYTKDEIMEMYLNQIYFGHGAYGIDAAARTFFAKDVGELTVAEGAQLAGMINGPSLFDPYQDNKASLERRDLVLAAMLKEGVIDQSQHDKAKAEQPKIGTKKTEAAKANAGHFTDYVINVLTQAKPGLAEKYGLKLGDPTTVGKAGLKVYTTIDPKLQILAEKAVADQMAQADVQYGLANAKGERPEAAMVTMNPKTGEVLAMVGGRTHQAMLEFNRATDALRQPGSAIKPLVAYSPALEAGMSPGTILDDAPVMLTTDQKTVWPQNYDFKYVGLKPMRYGVEQSLNPMAVRAMQAAGGPVKGADYARKFGLSTIGKDDEHLALALGGISQGTTVLDMTAAYSAVANMGVKVDPVIITKIVDAKGDTIFEANPKKTQVVKPTTAYMMIDMMKDVIRKGTAYGFTNGFKGWPAAGKTGTTESNRDSWFVGFTPELVTTVWTGYDTPTNHLPWTGAFVPVKMWNQFMTQAVAQKPADWPRPDGISTVSICRLTGMLPNDACPKDQIGSELFLRGTEPTSAGEILVKARAIQVTVPTPDKKSTVTEWQLWQPGCLAMPVDRTFINRPTPRVLHPTDPFNPKYVPADAKDELPTKTCQPGPAGWLDRWLPNMPWLPQLPNDQGSGNQGQSGQPGQPGQPVPAPGTPGQPVPPPQGGQGNGNQYPPGKPPHAGRQVAPEPTPVTPTPTDPSTAPYAPAPSDPVLPANPGD